VLALALAGCLSGIQAPPEDTRGNETATAPTRALNATEPQPVVGERGELVTERFLFASNHSLAILGNDTSERPLEKVPESFVGVGFFTSDPGATIKPWASFPARHPYEVAQDVDVTMRFVATQAGVSVTKGVFSPVGGWLGAPDRWAVYFFAPDAPDTIEAGKTYVMKMKAKMPEGGLFIREGEPLAVHAYLSYQTADNSPLSYVVGGPDPAMVVVPHVHFSVNAPNATQLLAKEGTKGPNPSPTTTQDPQPVDFTLDVPPGTAYVVAEVNGAATGANYDLDLALLGGTTALGVGSGPSPHEVVVLGPTSLAKAGGKLTARVFSAGAAGGSFKLVVTAYGA
jgi:hypothetical protein